jgi:hypothetical protein
MRAVVCLGFVVPVIQPEAVSDGEVETDRKVCPFLSLDQD